MKCSNCKKDKELQEFINDKGKQYKTCFPCRETNKIWKDKNKVRISLYNKLTNEKKTKEIIVCYARKKNTSEWIRFTTQAEAGKKLEVYTSNINKVIKGSIKSTGGYEFKTEKEIIKPCIRTWENVKKENDIKENVKGQPSPHRNLHTNKNNIIGKKCCTCKKWNNLINYNSDKNHWDNLRAECKDCLVKWRQKNRKQITQKQLIYEKNRRLTDPEFKLTNTLRSRLSSAFANKNAKKNTKTFELIGESVEYVMKYLESKFQDCMTWENHGKWHIDHKKPIALFNLTDKEEQLKCFHYTNLQPLWAFDNLSKGSKYKKPIKLEYANLIFINDSIYIHPNISRQTLNQKECKLCNTTKPISEYHKKNDTADGFQSYCNDCIRVNKQKWRLENKSSDKVFKCKYCEKTYKLKDSLTRHIKEKHPSE
jgi:hypothetical protein